MTLRQRLPRVRVPLAHGDPDVVLDLQAVFGRCYDEGAYARRLDYRGEPSTPLSKEYDPLWLPKGSISAFLYLDQSRLEQGLNHLRGIVSSLTSSNFQETTPLAPDSSLFYPVPQEITPG